MHYSIANNIIVLFSTFQENIQMMDVDSIELNLLGVSRLPKIIETILNKNENVDHDREFFLDSIDTINRSIATANQKKLDLDFNAILTKAPRSVIVKIFRICEDKDILLVLLKLLFQCDVSPKLSKIDEFNLSTFVDDIFSTSSKKVVLSKTNPNEQQIEKALLEVVEYILSTLPKNSNSIQNSFFWCQFVFRTGIFSNLGRG